MLCVGSLLICWFWGGMLKCSLLHVGGCRKIKNKYNAICSDYPSCHTTNMHTNFSIQHIHILDSTRAPHRKKRREKLSHEPMNLMVHSVGNKFEFAFFRRPPNTHSVYRARSLTFSSTHSICSVFSSNSLKPVSNNVSRASVHSAFFSLSPFSTVCIWIWKHISIFFPVLIRSFMLFSFHSLVSSDCVLFFFCTSSRNKKLMENGFAGSPHADLLNFSVCLLTLNSWLRLLLIQLWIS